MIYFVLVNHFHTSGNDVLVTTPLLEEYEDDTHTPEMGTWESSETPKTLELDCRGQNTSPWGILHIIAKLSKCKCRKWPHINHLDICSTSYGRKKGQESNWQFDSRPLKVGNQPDPGVCRWSATHRWKVIKENYKFSLDLIPIRGLRKKVMNSHSPRSPNQDSFGIPPWESRDKKPFRCRCHGVTQRILYGGRWWPPSSSGRGESCESRVARGLS